MRSFETRIDTGVLIIGAIGVVALVIAWLMIRRTYAKGNDVPAESRKLFSQAIVGVIFLALVLIGIWARHDGLSYRMASIAFQSAVTAYLFAMLNENRETLLVRYRSSTLKHRLLSVLMFVLNAALCGEMIRLMIKGSKLPISPSAQYPMIVLGVTIGTIGW